MLSSIYCEFFKLKRSHFYLSILLIASIMPLTLFLGWALQNHYVNWNKYFFQIEQMTFMVVTIPISTLISAYIFGREFSSKTISTLFCYPINKLKIFFSKLIVIMILTALAIIFQLLITILFGFILNHAQLTNTILFIHLKIAAINLLTLYAILPLAILITLVIKNIAVPLVYSFIISVGNVAILTITHSEIGSTLGNFLKATCDYVPTYYPLLSFSNCISESNSSKIMLSLKQPLTGTSIAVDLLFFIFVTFLCILYYSKCEVK